MSILEEKINALVRLVTAEDDRSYNDAKAELRELMTRDSKVPATGTDCEMEIRRILTVLGMPEHINGHRYTVEAIRLCVEKPEMMEYVTGELYPAVAKKFDTLASRVERAIRHAIEVSWDRGDMEIIQEYFGNTISFSKSRPTNSEFIARVSNLVRLKMEGAA